MNDRRVIWGGGFLALLALLAITAPWLGLRDPALQPDGLVLRALPPLSRVHAVALAGGGLQYAHEVRSLPDGSVEYLRGTNWNSLTAAELAGTRPEDWQRRPIYLLGTDSFGRDLLSRLIYGARVSLLIGFLAAAIATLVGTGLGLLSGLAGGWLDALLMRFTDLVLSVPRLFLALMIVALYGASLSTTVLVLAATTWMAAARLVRGEILSARELGFVQAARAAGAPRWRLGLLHLLPAALVPLSVQGTLLFGDTILLETALSFLGLGVPPPTPSWGNLIADGRHSLLDAWWIATLPGLAIAATILALNLLGDVARERLMGTKTENVRSGFGVASNGELRGRKHAGPRGKRKLVPALGRLVGLSILVSVATVSVAEESPVRLNVQRETGVARIVAHNDGPLPITVRLELTEQVNLQLDQALPLVVTVPARSEQTLLVVQRADRTLPWRYRYRWSWTEGVIEEQPEVKLAATFRPVARSDYTLPFLPGFAYQVAERLDDDPSHQDPRAIDWLIPAGTQVSAARGGTVARVAGGAETMLQILHEDGTIGTYRGLQDVRVRFGDPVETGELLGSIATAEVFGVAHLHFHVFRATREGTRTLVPLTFATSKGRNVELELRGVYMRPHDGDLPGEGGAWPLNAVQSVVTCRSIDRTGHPLDRTNRFGPEDVVHVHVAFGAPDIYPIQIDFVRAGETKAKSIRRFPTQPDGDGVHVTLDLGGVDQPAGEWIVETRIDGEVRARTEFSVRN